MYPPIYSAIAASAACKALLKAGQGELRFYQFGRAPQPVVKPYAVWQRVFGSPFEYLGNVPDMDSFTIQVDIYATSADQARAVALAVRNAIQYPHSGNMNFLGESRDPDTGNHRVTMQSDWLVERV